MTHVPALLAASALVHLTPVEHHVAANFSTVADAIHEATTRYLGWQMYRHLN